VILENGKNEITEIIENSKRSKEIINVLQKEIKNIK